MIIKAKGQARHRFWGDYTVFVSLAFASEEEADAAIEPLSIGELKWAHPNQRDTGKAMGRGLYIILDSAQCDVMEAHLAKYGVPKGKMFSIAHSIDYGEIFEVTLAVGEKADKNQIEMELQC
jgi:hypothetical protein